MELHIHEQALALLLALALGGLAGLLYDLLRPPRRRTGSVAAALLDILFCLLSGFGAFLYAMGAPSGRLGLWELTAMLLGFLGYLHALSPRLLPHFTAVTDLVCRAAGLCKKSLAERLNAAKKRYQNVQE